MHIVSIAPEWTKKTWFVSAEAVTFFKIPTTYTNTSKRDGAGILSIDNKGINNFSSWNNRSLIADLDRVNNALHVSIRTGGGGWDVIIIWEARRIILPHSYIDNIGGSKLDYEVDPVLVYSEDCCSWRAFY